MGFGHRVTRRLTITTTDSQSVDSQSGRQDDDCPPTHETGRGMAGKDRTPPTNWSTLKTSVLIAHSHVCGQPIRQQDEQEATATGATPRTDLTYLLDECIK
jgi:hypothetical protein